MALWIGVAGAIAAIAAVACAGSDFEPASPEDVEARGDRQDYDDAAEDDQSGWQWRGSRQDCFYVYDNECFSQREEACLAAGCEESACTHDDAAPAKVSCPDDE